MVYGLGLVWSLLWLWWMGLVPFHGLWFRLARFGSYLVVVLRIGYGLAWLV